MGIANQRDTSIKYNTIANIMPQITKFITVFSNEKLGLYSVFEIEYIISPKINISLNTVATDAPI